MTALPAPTVQPTRYVVCLLPDTHPGWVHYRLIVERVGGGRWTVSDGVSDYDATGRPAGILSRHLPAGAAQDALRFDLDTALDLASEAAPHVTVNGQTAAQVLLATWAAETPGWSRCRMTVVAGGE